MSKIPNIERTGSNLESDPTKTAHLTLTELADWLRCSTRTLQRLLSTGDGPPIIRLSERRVIFELADVRSWLASRRKGASIMPERRRRVTRVNAA
jgi:predicted DNA-binding transcriptional regulator AlpA